MKKTSLLAAWKDRTDGKMSVLRIRRVTKGTSLSTMAKKVGISHPYLSMIERGYDVSGKVRDRVCRFYGVHWKEAFALVEGTDDTYRAVTA